MPVNTRLFIRIPSGNGPAYVSLLSMSGSIQKSMEHSGEEASIEVGDVPPGMYIVSVRYGEKIARKKVLKY